jgi:hypothetical protein
MMLAMPGVPPIDRPATCEDLLKVPDLCVAEIVDRELHATPRPSPLHLIAASVIGGRRGLL